MKWHKISDGDYPKFFKDVLVAFSCLDGTYSEMGCMVAVPIETRDGIKKWITNTDTIVMSDSDRWAYIDLPTD